MVSENDRPPVLGLVDIEKVYGHAPNAVHALQHISLQVHQGEFLTLLGPSGSGKTTLLQLVVGLLTPTQGRIVLAGNDITSLPPERRNMGVVFQNYALFPHMTVAENIAYPLRLRRVPVRERIEKVDDALRMVELDGLGHRRVNQLSGGQQQRVAIARALAYEPDILLMDEPLGALDRALREAMQRELRDLQQRLRFTCVYVTHDQDEAIAMSDRIAVLAHGELQQVGTPEQIYRHPANAFVAGFIGEMNVLTGRVVSSGDDRAVRLKSGHVITIDAPAEVGSVARIGIRPEEFQPVATHGDGVLPLIVESVRFAGTHLEVTGRIDGGEEHIRLRLPAHMTVGDSLLVRAPSASVLILNVPDEAQESHGRGSDRRGN